MRASLEHYTKSASEPPQKASAASIQLRLQQQFGMDTNLVVYYDSDVSVRYNQLDATDPNPCVSGTTKPPHRRSRWVFGDGGAGNLPTPPPRQPVGAETVKHWVDSLHAKRSGRGNLASMPNRFQSTVVEECSKNPAESFFNHADAT